MRIALIHFRENYTPAPPMGILYIGTVLKNAGYEVRVLDSFPAYHDRNLKEVQDFQPNIIGVSVLTTGYRIASHYTSVMRRQLPRAQLCWGGVHASALPEEVLREQDLDFVVVGEGEETMLEVCARIEHNESLDGIKGVVFKRDGKILDNGRRNFIEKLDELPIPDRSLLRFPRFSWYLSPPSILRGKFYYGITTMYTSRGCPYQCIFCASRTVHGIRLRRRSVANVIKEMEYLKNDFGVTGVYFNDDTFATDMKWLREFCNIPEMNSLRMIWGCQTRASIAQDIDILRMMKRTGCVQVDIGCESGSDKVLKALKKEITPEMILKSFRNLKRLNMTTFATFILGNPEETLEDIRKTEGIAAHAPGGVSFLILVPYPGSPLYKMALDNKWFIDENVAFDERWTNKQSDVPVMEAGIKRNELVKIRARLQNKFFFRNNMPIIFSFLKNPYYLWQAVKTIIKNGSFVRESIRKAVKKRKAMDLLEDLYQKFNENLKK